MSIKKFLISLRRQDILLGCIVLASLSTVAIAFAWPVVKKHNFERFLETLSKEDFLEGALVSVTAKYDNSSDFLVAFNSGRRIHPGSNFKLFTAAAALSQLGPDFTFQTSLHVREAAGGRRDYVIVGGGDPSLSEKDLDGFVEAVKKTGPITGDLFYDDRIFSGQRLGPFWPREWEKEYFAVPITGLQLNDNLLEVRGLRSEESGRFEFTTRPLKNFTPIQNNLHYVNSAEELKTPVTARIAEGGELILEGDTMENLPFTSSAVVRKPSAFTAEALKQKLVTAGLVRPTARLVAEFVRTDLDPPIYMHRSPSLKELITRMLKFSKNNYGETLVRTLGREVKGEGSQERGVEVLGDFFEAIGLDPYDMSAFDGSGLSPATRATGASLIQLFEYVNSQSWRDIFWSALPESQVDGTLKHRFETAGLKNPVIAKTGTHQFSSSLSGKIVRDSRSILFSIHIFNHHFSTEQGVARIHPVIDKIVALLDRQF